jgi:hypothetical protein
MKRRLALFLSCILGGFWSSAALAGTLASPPERRPNIIVLLTDD